MGGGTRREATIERKSLFPSSGSEGQAESGFDGAKREQLHQEEE